MTVRKDITVYKLPYPVSQVDEDGEPTDGIQYTHFCISQSGQALLTTGAFSNYGEYMIVGKPVQTPTD